MREFYEYETKAAFSVGGSLLLSGQKIWVEAYDPVGGKAQRVFNSEQVLVGSISSDTYWDLKKNDRFIKLVK